MYVLLRDTGQISLNCAEFPLPVGLGVGVYDGLNEFLIRRTSLAGQTHQRLTAPSDGGQRLRVEPRQGWDPPLRPEPRHLLQLLVVGPLGEAEDGRVGVTQLVLVVDAGDGPALVGQAESLQLPPGIVDCPAVCWILLAVHE